MSRFLVLTIFLIVVVGLVLHFDYEVPWFTNWIGKLPGDMVIHKKGMVLYIPLATSALISTVVSILSSVLFSPSK